MSSTDAIASSSSTFRDMSLPSHDLGGKRLFPIYLQNFFKMPTDIRDDIIYCQRNLKNYIKVHQMVLEVFEQQPNADPHQMQQILNDLEGDMYEINAEQSYLFLRLRRIIDEFMKMLNKTNIPIDDATTNAYISKEIVPLINDTSIQVEPTSVKIRSNEDKLIEKYFEIHKETTESDDNNMEIIDLDMEDDDAVIVVEEKMTKVHGSTSSGNKRKHASSKSAMTGESLLKNLHTQPSLLKPLNQRKTRDSLKEDKPVRTLGDLYKKKKEEKLMNQIMAQDLIPMDIDVKPKINQQPVKSFDNFYQQQKKEEKEQKIELPVSTSVEMCRKNLRQALMSSQAAFRRTNKLSIAQPQPPPPPPLVPLATVPEVVKKSNATKARGTRAAAAGAIAPSSSTSQKSPVGSSSSEDGTPERGHTPPHNYWPDEFEETRTKAEEYGQEMFLQMYSLCTPEMFEQLQQRRSKRRRRCVKNNNYHYGRIDHHHLPSSTSSEQENKKKRKAFLLSPQVKKALPGRRKRSSNDNNSATPSRSASSSPNEKRSCNECLKTGLNLEQCEECKFYYHSQCHREEDDLLVAEDPKNSLNALNKCPGCKRKHGKAIKEGLLIHKNLQCCAQDLELQYAKEKDRREILQRTGKSYKIQMNNLFKIVKSFRDESSTSNSANIVDDDDVILLD